ncbi:Fibronectin type III domain-containing protein 7 [Liparis tanakae]|uniref:Fibronectin type III domain-containing protein 7 n=1 Tax=Liparis tanakae TaxID=230148 RepID=A0A4Z2HPS4_9TELE|nr:Fibronectin type III domain-containing protein 7 [Liparis tanakae]
MTQTNNSTFTVHFTTPNYPSTSYTVTAFGRYGTHTCQSSNSSCQLTQLPCGSTYEVIAVATTAVGRSPCCPASVNVTQVTQAMTNVTWSSGSGARSYVTSLTSSRGHAKCHTLDNHCLMGCITCGTNYSLNLQAISSTGHTSDCKYRGFSSSACCPTSVKLYRRDNNSLRVHWRSIGALMQNHTVELNGTAADYTCVAAAGSKYCDIQEETCGDVYTVVVVPVGQNGLKVNFCQPRRYSVLCPGSNAGMGCPFLSVTSPSASSLYLRWSGYAGASVYLLDLRVVNSTSIAPLVVMQTAPSTERRIQGLRPGSFYQVTLKVFEFYTIVCTNVEITTTVPATSQVTFSKALSSTSIQFEWSSVSGAHSYILFVEELFSSPAENHNRTFTNLSGQVDGLTPSTTYNCYVYALNGAGRSARSSTRTITTLVPPPTGVALVSTGRSTARVTWSSVSRVLLYQVAVHDNDAPGNAPVIRNTSATSMDISNLEPCSFYTVGVSSINFFLIPGEASDVTHNTATINPVTTISADYSCSSGMVTVTWDLVFGANLYKARAVDSTGASNNCTSASTSCQITMLKCGETYAVRVTAFSDDCESTSNATSSFETVPCAPAHPQTRHDCSSNVIVYSWQTTNNTLYYVATAVDGAGRVTECRTPDNTCYFTNTGCGQYYKYTVYAVSPDCNTEVSQPEFVRTSPCLPTTVKTGAGCHSDMLLTTWDSAAGALSYTVEAQGNTGEIYNCTSSANSCAVTGVPCGEHLSVWILASNDNCSTDRVLGDVAQTVPCSPLNFSASVDCSQDSVKANWTATIGAIFYIAVAEDQSGNVHSCNSMATNCLIEGLRCGQNYTASVIGSNLDCNSSASEEVNFTTAPCSPTNIEAFRDCDANHALIVWQNNQLTGLYTAAMEDQSGARLTCTSSTVNNCKISSLPCGKRYNVTVTYSDGKCPSTSTPIIMNSVPCGPEDVRASVACVTGELTVSWNISVPAENYTTFISRGMGQPVYLPCPPTAVTVAHACAPTPVPVSWVASASARRYTAVAVSAGGHRSECTADDTSCSLAGLQCGAVYTVGVSGADDNCTGRLSDTVSLNTEPCSPYNVSSQLMCSAATALVSWPPSANAVSYAVRATGDGQNLTCSSLSTNCTLSPLVCGHAYSILVSAADGTCVSNFSDTFIQDQAPCPPSGLTAVAHCGASSLRASWNASVGAASYTTTVTGPGGFSETSSTPNLTRSVSGLRCGSRYNVTVTSRGGCSSSPSHTVLTTGPCDPVNVTSVLQCGSDSAAVSWDAAAGAVRYTVHARLDGAQHSTSCSSSTTSCQLKQLQCGKVYNLTVTAEDDTCNSTGGISTPLMTAPCAPSVHNSSLVCGSSSSSLAWRPMACATAYTVNATATNGHTASCSSATATCTLTDLLCSETYTTSIIARGGRCDSAPGSGANITTAPCSPAILSKQYTCGNNTAVFSWTDPVGRVDFLAQVSREGFQDTCRTTNTECAFHNLACGLDFNLTVRAQGAQCDSIPSVSESMETAPCEPTNFTGHVDCGTNKGNFSWSESRGASFYTVEVSGELGHVASCSSSDASCAVKLRCGRSYSASLVASTESCNSSKHADFNFDSAPCLPDDVSAELQCDSNVMNVSWTQTPGQDEYTAWAISPAGHRASCNSSSNSCSIRELRCGEVYEVAVTSSSIHCTIIAGSDYTLQSAPCKPENTTVEQNCSSNAVTVRWDQSSTTQNYTVQATCASGVNSTCDSPGSSCSFLDLSCGQLCTFTASMACEQLNATVSWQQSDLAVGYVAYFDNHNGHHASCVGSDAHTRCGVSGLMCGAVYDVCVKALAPCLPREVEVEVDCSSDRAAVVSWNATEGAANLSLSAIVNGSLQTLCVTQQHRCHVTTLTCGETYNLSFTAVNTQCSLTAPMHTNLTTRPCPPQLVAADLRCGSRTAVLSWEERSDVELYVARAVKTSGGEVRTCNSTGATCPFAGLECGETHNVSVTACSRGCCSRASSTALIQTEPCQPVLVSAQALCQSDGVQISWHQADGAVNYVVTASGSLGHLEVHNTTQTRLSAALPCGQLYNVTVRGRGSQCDSSPSSPASFRTTPCVPREVRTSGQCASSGGSVSWAPSDGAETYGVVATGLHGHTQRCLTNTTSCTWTGLRCGDQYAVVVRAQEGNCSSLPSNSSVIHMAPCAPQNVSAAVACDSKVVSLSWDAANGTHVYAVSGEAGNQTVGLTTNVTTAHFPDFACGQNYSLTVTPHNGLCPGNSSAAVTIETWPCPPAGISTMQDCLSGIVMVTWQASNGSAYYTAAMQTDTGLSEMCMSDSDECSVPSLSCGHNFSVSVTASSGRCEAVSRQSARLQSVPCAPTNVSVGMDCTNNTARVAWSASRGAERYSVTAHSSHSNVSCHTSAHSCSLDNVTCGHRYAVQVVAMNDDCSSVPSQALVLTSAPCPPQNVSSEVSCGSNDVTVSWDADSEAEHFVVSVTSADGGGGESCNTTSTACSVSNLTCGSTFRVQVASVRGACRSQPGPAHSVRSAPCQPQGVTGRLDCVTNAAEMSWDAAPGAERYAVSAVGGGGHAANCTASSNTTCEVADLACGVLYNFSVTAGNSKSLCSLAGITAVPQCHNSSILVLWDLMEGGEGDTVYTATAEAADRSYLSCNSTATGCYLRGARCDLHYTVVVAASSDQCSSLRSPPSRISMEPCPPRDVVVNATCEDSGARVSWSPSPVADTYHVVAVGADGRVYTYGVAVQLIPMQMEVQVLHFSWPQVSCSEAEYQLQLTGSLLGDGQAQFQLSSYWTSVAYFEMPLPCGSSYSATVESRSAAGTSAPSAPLNQTTAPCPPSGVEYSGNGSFATVAWNASVFASSYTVYDPSATPPAQLCSTAGLSCSLANVASPNLLITASNAAGESETTSVPQGGLSAPVLNVTQATPTVVFIEWSPIAAASHYSLEIREQRGSAEPQSITVQGESVILTELRPHAAYCFSVSAEAEAASGPESEPVCVQTGPRPREDAAARGRRSSAY